MQKDSRYVKDKQICRTTDIKYVERQVDMYRQTGIEMQKVQKDL